MASMPLVGTYKRYKAGIQKLVTWLGESANRCRSQSTAKKSPKKVANTAKKVTTAELVELAKVIVDSKSPVVEIGIDILDVCKDAINGRSSASKWYQAIAKQNLTSKEAEVLAASNNSHLHFLKILENVFETLRREHKARRPKRKKQVPKLASDTDDLTNLYQHLQLGDLESDDEGTAPPQARSTPTPTHSASDGPTYELDNEAEDKSFALYCSFKDFFDIRMYDGNMTFMAAAKVTQAAMMLNSESARAFEDAHPDLTTFDMIINHLGCHSFLHVATWTQLKEYTEDTRSRIPSHEESSDLLCMRAWRVLNKFRQIQRYVWVSDDERQCAPFFGKKPEETWPSHPLSKVLIDVAFKIRETYPWLLTESWDFDRCGRFAGLASVLDPYTRQLLAIMRFKTFDAADVASTQIYLDIFDALQGDMPRGLSEAQMTVEHAKADEQADHDRLSEELGLDN
ncbi:hypothetical protein Slin15195_G074400 [Septoria linicola]|uniref:DUF6604 domain-containing protein n=1 Tax=Septoria linicola TaxID=215465 RepID=A0A9Q9EJU0_9PEZI|nr:hypothetical protein Slin15195_G074400 [Septoria linicola]